MLLHYFGSKAGVFEAALVETMHVETLFGEKRGRFGEHLAGLFLDASVDIKAPSILALSAGHADARDIATRLTDAHVIEPLAKWLGPPDAHARALEIVMLAMGFVICTRLYPLASGRKGADKKLARWLAQALQAIVDQS
jgi:Tetracyclin repressor-like, C-terminal domain